MSRYTPARDRRKKPKAAPPPPLEQTGNFKALAATGPLTWPPRVWLSGAPRERRSFQEARR